MGKLFLNVPKYAGLLANNNTMFDKERLGS